MTRYAWMVTTDHTEGSAKPVDVVGPRGAEHSPEVIRQGEPFRMRRRCAGEARPSPDPSGSARAGSVV